MKSSSSLRVLLLVIAVLVLSNVCMLVYFTRSSGDDDKPRNRSERMAAMMRSDLDFSDAQVAEYLLLRKRRDSLLRPLQLELRVAKLDMLKLLGQEGVTDSAVQKAAETVAARQVPLELVYFSHFQRIKAMCNPNQQAAFDSMLVRMVRRNTGDTTGYSQR
jgi:predicted RNA-binding protein YlqC (UPF0109 family)